MRALAEGWWWLYFRATLLAKDGLGGKATLVLLLLAIVCSLIAVLQSVRRSASQRSARMALIVTLACSGLALLVGTVTANAARSRAEASLTSALTLYDSPRVEYLDVSQTACLLLSVAALWLVPALTFVIVRLASQWLTRALVLSAAPLLLVTVLSSFEQANSLTTNLGCGDPSLIRDGAFEYITWVRDRARSLELFVTLAAALSLVLAVGAALREARRAYVVTPATLWFGATLLLLGGTAFALTRPLARDAEQLVTHEQYAPAYEALCSNAPIARQGCTALPEAPVVQASSAGFSIDGVPAPLSELRKVLVEKRKLRELLAPHAAPLRAVGLVAPEETHWDLLKPLLTALREEGFNTLWIVQQKPRGTIYSATLGVTLRHQQCCATALQLDLEGFHPAPTTTLGELLNRAAATNPAVLRLAVGE